MDYHLLNFRKTHSSHQYNISFPDGNESGKCTVVQVTTYKNIWRGEGYGYTAAVSLHRLDMRLPEIAVLLLVQQPCSSCSQHISHGTHFFHILTSKLENPKH